MRANIVVSLIAASLSAACGGSDEVEVSPLVGAECDVDDECEESCLGPSNDFPGGFCSIACGAIDDCPSDTDCVDLEGGVCLFICVDNLDCEFLGPDWTCQEANLREDQNVKVDICRGN